MKELHLLPIDSLLFAAVQLETLLKGSETVNSLWKWVSWSRQETVTGPSSPHWLSASRAPRGPSPIPPPQRRGGAQTSLQASQGRADKQPQRWDFSTWVHLACGGRLCLQPFTRAWNAGVLSTRQRLRDQSQTERDPQKPKPRSPSR